MACRFASAFLPRPNEDHLSLNWLDLLDARDITVAIGQVRAGFQRRSFGLKSIGRFAILNVGRSRESATQIRRKIQFEHRPLPGNDSHAGIVGISEDDLALATELARLVSRGDVHPAIT